MNKTTKRTISLLLVVVMLIASLSMTVLSGSAAEADCSELRLLDNTYGKATSVKHSNTSVTINGYAAANINVSFRLTDQFVNNQIPPAEGVAAGTDSSDFYHGVSFTMQKNTDKAPYFLVRVYSLNKKIPNLLIVSDNKLIDHKTGSVICEIGSDPIDVFIALKWNDGDNYVTYDAYVDRVYCGTYETKTVNGALDTIDSLQIFYDKNSMTANDEFSATAPASITFSNVYENLTCISPDNYIYDGAAMRLDADPATSGLRFAFGVQKEYFDALTDAKVGAIILPTDKLGGAEFSEAALLGLTEGEDYILMEDIGFNENAAEADEDTYAYYASLISIKEQNYARSFTAVGFVELSDGKRIYTGSQSRSVYEVAANATASGDYEGEENAANKALLAGYLGKVVSLGADFTVGAIENYTSPFVGAALGEGFTVTGEGVANIKAIIIGGEVYTGGWTVDGNVLTVAGYTAE